MKYAYLFLLFFSSTLGCAAQGVQEPLILQSIGTTGGYAVDSSSSLNYNISYTVGEMSAVKTDTTPDGQPLANGLTYLTQGFEQPDDFPTGLIDLETGDYGSFVVYPNPAVDYFSFGFQFPGTGKVSIVLYSELGQRIATLYNMNYGTGKVVNSSNISTLAAGNYMVSLTFTEAADGNTHTLSKKLVIIK